MTKIHGLKLRQGLGLSLPSMQHPAVANVSEQLYIENMHRSIRYKSTGGRVAGSSRWQLSNALVKQDQCTELRKMNSTLGMHKRRHLTRQFGLPMKFQNHDVMQLHGGQLLDSWHLHGEHQ